MHAVSQDVEFQIILWSVLQHSSTSFYKLIKHFGSAELALQPKQFSTWQNLKLHKNHLERLQKYYTSDGQAQAKTLLQQVALHSDDVLHRDHPHYPNLLHHFENSTPLLFIKGDAHLLNLAQIAVVGSRAPSPHGHKIAYDFADYFSSENYITTSGLAAGIDAAAHQGAIRTGRTIAVIGTGLEQCYPKANQKLQDLIVQQGGCIVTQFLPFTPALKVNFPKRNSIISGMSLGTLVVEAGLNSGSLITAKAAAEQGKQVFAIPGHIYSPQHQGCHQLIREGAILVDHPAQVLEDLGMFESNQIQRLNATPPAMSTDISAHLPSDPLSPSIQNLQPSIAPQTSTQLAIDIPSHLKEVYDSLDWMGISIDQLCQKLGLGVSEMNTALMELELLGYCKEHAGRYLKA